MSLGNLRIVLVRPKFSGNIGAAARAMSNCGIRELHLVNPATINRKEVDTFAVHARDVVEGMAVHETLQDAIGPCGFVVGTTCRKSPYRSSGGSLDVISPLIVSRLVNNRVALVFGPEDTGLTNKDLFYCNRLLRIPTDKGFASLNVAQAVLLSCHAVFSVYGQTVEQPVDPRLATGERQQFMLDRLEEALSQIDFLNPENPDHIMLALRDIFGRAGLHDRDVQILLGIAHRIGWYSRGKREESGIDSPNIDLKER